MQMESATLDNIEGVGNLVLTVINGRNVYRGSFESNNISAMLSIAGKPTALYNGSVFVGSNKTRQAITVQLGQSNTTLAVGIVAIEA